MSDWMDAALNLTTTWPSLTFTSGDDPLSDESVRITFDSDHLYGTLCRPGFCVECSQLTYRTVEACKQLGLIRVVHCLTPVNATLLDNKLLDIDGLLRTNAANVTRTFEACRKPGQLARETFWRFQIWCLVFMFLSWYLFQRRRRILEDRHYFEISQRFNQ